MVCPSLPCQWPQLASRDAKAALLAFDIPGVWSPLPTPSKQYGFPTWGSRHSKSVSALFPSPTLQVPQTDTRCRRCSVWLSHLMPSPTIFVTKGYVSKCHTHPPVRPGIRKYIHLGASFQDLGCYPTHCSLWSQISSRVKRRWVLSSHYSFSVILL